MIDWVSIKVILDHTIAYGLPIISIILSIIAMVQSELSKKEQRREFLFENRIEIREWYQAISTVLLKSQKQLCDYKQGSLGEAEFLLWNITQSYLLSDLWENVYDDVQHKNTNAHDQYLTALETLTTKSTEIKFFYPSLYENIEPIFTAYIQLFWALVRRYVFVSLLQTDKEDNIDNGVRIKSATEVEIVGPHAHANDETNNDVKAAIQNVEQVLREHPYDITVQHIDHVICGKK